MNENSRENTLRERIKDLERQLKILDQIFQKATKGILKEAQVVWCQNQIINHLTGDLKEHFLGYFKQAISHQQFFQAVSYLADDRPANGKMGFAQQKVLKKLKDKLGLNERSLGSSMYSNSKAFLSTDCQKCTDLAVYKKGVIQILDKYSLQPSHQIDLSINDYFSAINDKIQSLQSMNQDLREGKVKLANQIQQYQQQAKITACEISESENIKRNYFNIKTAQEKDKQKIQQLANEIKMLKLQNQRGINEAESVLNSSPVKIVNRAESQKKDTAKTISSTESTPCCDAQSQMRKLKNQLNLVSKQLAEMEKFETERELKQALARRTQNDKDKQIKYLSQQIENIKQKQQKSIQELIFQHSSEMQKLEAECKMLKEQVLSRNDELQRKWKQQGNKSFQNNQKDQILQIEQLRAEKVRVEDEFAKIKRQSADTIAKINEELAKLKLQLNDKVAKAEKQLKKVKVDSEVRLSTESAKLKKEAEDKITKIKQESVKLKKDMQDHARKKDNDLTKQKNKIKEEIQQIKQTLDDTLINLSTTKEQLSSSDKQRNEMQLKITMAKEIQSELRNKVARGEQVCLQIDLARNRIVELEYLIEMAQQAHLLKGDIFKTNKRVQEKHFVIKCLEQTMKARCRQTQFLYKPDPHNQTNFHEYIDNRPSLLILIETNTNMLIAGFYAGALTKNGEMKEDSLLMSVTNRRMFRKKPGARGLVYDKFYYILGNAELRIRTNEKKVFSNFAIVNTNFETQNETVGMILNNGNEREAEYIAMEFHQVLFKQ